MTFNYVEQMIRNVQFPDLTANFAFVLAISLLFLRFGHKTIWVFCITYLTWSFLSGYSIDKALINVVPWMILAFVACLAVDNGNSGSGYFITALCAILFIVLWNELTVRLNLDFNKILEYGKNIFPNKWL